MPPKPKPPKRKNKERERKVLEKRLETLTKEIIAWRDASQCVEHGIDGSRCRGRIVWGHFVTQHNCPILRYSLSNVFCQCDGHNFWHAHHDLKYVEWYTEMFGKEPIAILNNIQAANVGKDLTEEELRYWIGVYGELYENRFYVGTDIESLVAGGYYGNAIRSAWLSAGRIKEWR